MSTVGRAALLLIVLAGALWLGGIVEESSAVKALVSELGYVGVFVISVASGFNIVVPVPVVAFFPIFLAAGFGFWVTLVVMTLGMTVGDSLGFLIGYAGRRVAEESGRGGRVFVWFERLRQRFKLGAHLVLFLYAAFVPLPNELLVIPMSFAGYRFRFMIPAVFIGNLLFNTLVALGIVGVIQLF